MIINVDRRRSIALPQKTKKVLYPNLIGIGPQSVDLDSMVRHRRTHHELARRTHCTGAFVHKLLLEDLLIASCLELADLVAMRDALSVKSFSETFGVDAQITAWRSAIEMREMQWYPSLAVDSVVPRAPKMLRISWNWFGSPYSAQTPTYVHKTK